MEAVLVPRRRSAFAFRACALAAFLLLALVAHAAPAPAAGVRGTIVDFETKAPISGVRVTLTSLRDTTVSWLAVSADDGGFGFATLPTGQYRLSGERLGYLALRQMLTLDGNARSLGVIGLQATAVPVGGVEVKAAPPTVVQNADTTEFSAKAVQTHPDANGEDLVGKMPGVEVDTKGAVKSNGESIQQVLVDGKPFFSSDPKIALRHLPASVIDKIQIYDKLSDQAEFSGFDDGETIKTMNIVLRKDRAPSFGKAYGGGSRDGRYQAGGDLNVINNGTRLVAMGMSNNVNQQNFSSQDLLDAQSSGGHHGGLFSGSSHKASKTAGSPGNSALPDASDALVGSPEGIATTTALGVHLDTSLGHKLNLIPSYFFNDVDNQSVQDVTRRYWVPVDSSAAYGQHDASGNRDINNRLEGRMEWAKDSTFVDVPKLYFENDHETGAVRSSSFPVSGQPILAGQELDHSVVSGHDVSNHLILRRRLGNPRRTVSVDFGASHQLKHGGGDESSLTWTGPLSTAANDTLDQVQYLNTATSTLAGRLEYTEPVSRDVTLEARLSSSHSDAASDHAAFRFDPLTGRYSEPESTLTRRATNSSTSQSAGVACLVRMKGMKLTTHLAWQVHTLESDGDVEAMRVPARTFSGLAPSIVLNQDLSHHRNLKLSYITSRRLPSLSQLEAVPDISNPLVVTVSNPSLRPEFHQSLYARYSTTDPKRSRGLFLMGVVEKVAHPFSTLTQSVPRDMVLSGVALRSGAQLVTPINLDEAWSASGHVTYSRPANLLKSILNFHTSLSWSRTPSITDQVGNLADNYAVGQSVTLASNISPAVDFTASYNVTCNLARNSAPGAQDLSYFNRAGVVRLNVIAWNVVMRQELTSTVLGGGSGSTARTAALWNTSLGNKLLHDRLDLRLTATDVLAQDHGASEKITGSYLQDIRNQTLPRFLMFTATYTWGR